MNTFHLATVKLAEPVTVFLPSGPRHRVFGTDPKIAFTAKNGLETILSELECVFWINVVTQTIHAQIARIPNPLLIYGPEDFAHVATDVPELHGDRVLQILGNDPANALQALIAGGPVTLPARVPRSIRHWQAVNVLREMGVLERVEAMVEVSGNQALKDAWIGLENLSRKSPSVIAIAAALGMDATSMDDFFIAAGKLGV